jgi:hypothetical protein
MQLRSGSGLSPHQDIPEAGCYYSVAWDVGTLSPERGRRVYTILVYPLALQTSCSAINANPLLGSCRREKQSRVSHGIQWLRKTHHHHHHRAVAPSSTTPKRPVNRDQIAKEIKLCLSREGTSLPPKTRAFPSIRQGTYHS